MSQYIRWPSSGGGGGSPTGPAGGDLTGTYPNPTIGAGKVTNAKMANMATMTIKGNSTGGSAAPQDLSVTTVTSMLNAFVGDSGSGGTKGMVPAPTTGDATKFLKGDGTWGTPAGSGDVVGPASSVDGQVALFDLTTGKLLKAATSSGVAKVASGVLSASNVSLTSEVTGTLPVGNGGTGVTSLSDVLGTTNQVSVSGGTARVIGGNVTLSLPQDIATSSSPSFANVTGTTSLLTPLVKATSSGGLDFQANSGTAILNMGAGGGNNVTFEGNVVHKGSVALRETGGGTDSVTLSGPSATTGYTITLPGTAPTADQSLTYSGSAYVWSAVSLTAGVTGVLPLANGGTNKNMTAVAGGLVWTDSDSMEVSAAGTAGNWVLSGGTGAPTMSNTTTTAKTIDGSADAVQLTVEGHSTQTSNILAVQKSDATNLLAVTNTSGTNIRGTTTNDSAATGFVGEYVEAVQASYANAPTSGQYGDVTSISLTAGDWDVSAVLEWNLNTGTAMTNPIIGIGTASGNSSSGLSGGNTSFETTPPTSSSNMGQSIPVVRKSLSATTTIYLKYLATYSGGTPRARGRISARRVR